MKVSLNIIKQFIDFDLPPVDELVQKINQQLGGVEQIIDLNAKYKDAKIVKVVECAKHPNADKLSVCKIDVGSGELTQVVCGAPNVHADMWAVWLPPGSTVPASFDDAEPFVLEPKDLRGETSNGMLASARELAIGDDHNGIIEITEKDLRTKNQELKPGLSFAKVFGLDDQVIEIENKMFTHRPDLFGQLGVAREIFAILQPEPASDKPTDTSFKEEDWYWKIPEFNQSSGLELEVFNDAPDKVPRFMAVAMQDVAVKPSPLWLQCALVAMGSKPINNVVDITNYLMLITAQPTHAYDYDKLAGHKLGARLAKKGETAQLLNGKTYQLDEADIVIADEQGVVGLAGVMGGGDSEVSADTKSIVLEVANFDMYTVRKTSMRHGLFTDAVTRFNKGQSRLQNDRVMSRLIQLLSEFTGADQASPVFDVPEFKGDKTTLSNEMIVNQDFMNQRLGLNLNANQIGNLLRFVNFASYSPGEDKTELAITAPFWRTDIELPEDIVEEVGRLYGFDKLPLTLPTRSIKPAPQNAKRELKQKIRKSLAKAGANEVLTYSFVHKNLLEKACQDPAQAFQLSNALSPDLHYYRLSVLPSLLDKVHANIKSGHDEFTLFEIGKAHNKTELADDGLPVELEMIDAVYASKNSKPGAAFYQLKSQLNQLAKDLKLGQLVYKPVEKPLDFPLTAPFDQARSALLETTAGEFLGIIGELKQSVKQAFKLPSFAAAMSLDFIGLLKTGQNANQTYRPLSKFPTTSQDICLRVSSQVSFAALKENLEQTLAKTDYQWSLEPIDIYQKQPDTKQITFRIKLAAWDKTLTSGDAKAVIDQLVNEASQKLKAEII